MFLKTQSTWSYNTFFLNERTGTWLNCLQGPWDDHHNISPNANYSIYKGSPNTKLLIISRDEGLNIWLKIDKLSKNLNVFIGSF